MIAICHNWRFKALCREFLITCLREFGFGIMVSNLFMYTEGFDTLIPKAKSMACVTALCSS